VSGKGKLIYSPTAATIPIPEILAELEARGLPVDWRSMFLSEREPAEDWSIGWLTPRDQPEPRIELDREPLNDDVRAEILEAVSERLSASQLAILQNAEVAYRVDADPGPDADVLLVNLVDIIAVRTDGLVDDIDLGQFLRLCEFRTRYAPLLRRRG
jgi:hypothetical protein